MTGASADVKMGTLGINTSWKKTGGQDDIAEMYVSIVLTRETVLKDLATTKKMTIWWPNSATTEANV